jgi:saccharopine dehydrogenase-like NADP-dependent oxidoreductase
VQVDIHDEQRLASMAANYDIIVNVAGPEWEVLLPALRGAIAAGTQYCDIGADGATTEKQLELDSMARERDILAVVGIGYDPGLSNLLAVHATLMLNRVDEVQLCHHWGPSKLLSEAVDELRKTGRVDTSWQDVVKAASGPVRIYRDRQWTAIDPLENGVNITTPKGGTVTAFPAGTPEPITLPRYLPSVRSVSSVMGVSPPQLGDLFFREAQRISRGELTAKDATKSFLETIGTDLDRWLKIPEGSQAPSGWDMWVVATGWKEGRRASYTCWPGRVPASTSIPLTVGTLRILRGEVSARGVLPPEACFEPMPFFEEMAQYAKEEDRDKPLLGESLEWLSY